MDTKIEKSTFKRKKLIIPSALLTIVSALVYACYGNSGSELKVDRQRLKISSVELGEFQDYVPVRASVMPIETIFLDVVQGGSIEEVYVEEGALVTRGQSLARLSNSMLQLDVISREAEVSEQLNFLRNTQLSLEQNLLNLRERRLEMDYDIKVLKRRLHKSEKLLVKNYISEDEVIELHDSLQFETARREVVDASLTNQQVVRETQLEQLESSAAHLKKIWLLREKTLMH